MTWFRVDDNLGDHPKVIKLLGMRGGAASLGHWTLVGSWCAKHETDGALPAGLLKRLDIPAKSAASLVIARLWDAGDDSYQVHNYLRYNPSHEELEAKRKATRERVAKHRDKPPGDSAGNGVTNEIVPDPYPTRPVPTLPNPEESTPPDNPVFVHLDEVGKEFSTRRKATGGQGFKGNTGNYTMTTEREPQPPPCPRNACRARRWNGG